VLVVDDCYRTDTQDPQQDLPLPASLQDMERENIRRTVLHFGGHRGLAAPRLGIDRKTLWRRMRHYSLADKNRER